MTTATLPPGTAGVTTARVFPEPSPWLTDPEGWVGNRLRESLWSKQREIMASVLNERFTAVHSCHDSGKSYTASRAAAWWIDAHEPGDAFVVSTAPSQTQVEAILWREIGRAHRKGELIGRITSGMVPMWKLGSEIVGFGRKPQDLKSKEDAMAAFQGIHARFVLIILDEAGGVPKWLWDAVDTLATNESARVLAIGNPDDPAAHFAQVCKPGSGWNVHHISAFDTPNFTGEEVTDDVADALISRLWVEERKKRWGEGSPLYISKVKGEFPEISDDTLLAPVLLNRAMENDFGGPQTRSVGRYGYDIARFGQDETCGYRNRGGVIRGIYFKHKQSTMKTAGAIRLEVGRHKGKAPAYVDVIGIGGGVVDRCLEWGLNVIPHDGAARANNRERFVNRRAEVYWEFREQLENDELDLPARGEDDDLYAQLGAIRWFIKNGKIQIESKEDMKKRGLPSPDRADGCVMSAIRGASMYIPVGRDGPPDENQSTLTGDLMRREM